MYVDSIQFSIIDCNSDAHVFDRLFSRSKAVGVEGGEYDFDVDWDYKTFSAMTILFLLLCSPTTPQHPVRTGFPMIQVACKEKTYGPIENGSIPEESPPYAGRSQRCSSACMWCTPLCDCSAGQCIRICFSESSAF